MSVYLTPDGWRGLTGANGATSSSHRQAQKSKFDPREW